MRAPSSSTPKHLLTKNAAQTVTRSPYGIFLALRVTPRWDHCTWHGQWCRPAVEAVHTAGKEGEARASRCSEPDLVVRGRQ